MSVRSSSSTTFNVEIRAVYNVNVVYNVQPAHYIRISTSDFKFSDRTQCARAHIDSTMVTSVRQYAVRNGDSRMTVRNLMTVFGFSTQPLIQIVLTTATSDRHLSDWDRTQCRTDL